MAPSHDREPSVGSSDLQPKRHQEPLYLRMYFQRHLTELVRLFGYREIPALEVRELVEPLIAKYGRTKIFEATTEILFEDGTRDPPVARLTDHARKLAVQILGSPRQDPAILNSADARTAATTTGVGRSGHSSTPDVAASGRSEIQPPEPGLPQSEAQTSPRRREKRKRTKAGDPEPEPAATEPSPRQSVELSRTTALRLFESWLTERKQTFVVADAKKRSELAGSKIGTLDFIVYEKPVNRLVTVRKKLTAVQIHDMQEWRRILGDDFQPYRLWPNQWPDGLAWHFFPVE